MSAIEEIERKVNIAMQLLKEAASALAEEKKGAAPAQVMSRIQAAQAARPQLQAPLQLMPKQTEQRKAERAAFYLHIAMKADPTNDILYRVIGDDGVMEALRMEQELKENPLQATKRLDSREYEALVKRRVREARHNAGIQIGTITAVDLRGPQVQQ